jgi:hypothetical protein
MDDETGNRGFSLKGHDLNQGTRSKVPGSRKTRYHAEQLGLFAYPAKLILCAKASGFRTKTMILGVLDQRASAFISARRVLWVRGFVLIRVH